MNMKRDYILAIDIGTSRCKIILFDIQGRVISGYTGEYPTYHGKGNIAEQNAWDWWEQICRGINHIKQENQDLVKHIVGIGVDGHSWACLPVDQEGTPLRKAMIWLDRRADEQARYLKDTIGERTLLNINGNPSDPAYITPKMLWIKANEPEIYQRTYKFLQSNAYIVYQLTGRFSQDYSQCYGFSFFNIHHGTWEKEMADDIGVSLDLTAPLYHCHQVVGKVTKTAASQTGLPAGIPVVAGGLDAACSTLGAGVYKPGQTQEQGGQAGGMSIQVAKPLIHPKLILGYHVIPDQWLLQGGTVGGGGILNWFNKELGLLEQIEARKAGITSYQVISNEVEPVSPGSEGLIFLPYMAGERSPIWNSNARGVLFGMSYEKTRAHLLRSMMEGVGYSLKHNLETAAEVGATATELRSVGGAANSRVWTQIKADITGKNIVVPFADHATSLGAAMLAGVGVGVYQNFPEAVSVTVKDTRMHYPDLKNYKLYIKYYELYLTLYKQLEESFNELSEINQS